jgi:hypothetical protein
LSLLLATLAAREASGQPTDDATRGAARTLGTSGVSAYMEGNYAVAKEQLERSFYLFPIPTLGLWSARALAKVGSLVEAAERYRQVSLLPVDIGDVAIQRAAQASAEQERNELLPRIAGLKFRVIGANVEDIQIAVDGAVLDASQVERGLDVNPGSHAVTGQRGDERFSSAVELLEGQRQTVELRLAERAAPSTAPVVSAASPSPLPVAPAPAPLPAPAPPLDSSEDTHRLLRGAGWVSVGLGAAGLGTGVVAYFLARSKYQEIHARCPNDICEIEDRALVDQYDRRGTVSVAGLIAGGVFGAVGVTLLVLSRESSSDVSVTAAGSSIAMRGTF